MPDALARSGSPVKSTVVALTASFAAVVGVYAVLATIGARQAASGGRALGQLAPVFELWRTAGSDLIIWLTAHSPAVAGTATAIALAIAVAALSVAGWRATRVLLLAAAVSFGSWGQAMLVVGDVTSGVWLYGAGVVCAIGLGVWCPMSRLSGFVPVEGDAVAITGRRLPLAWECAVVVGLTILATLMRLYALNELPNGFDVEMMVFTLLSRTGYGLAEYVRWAIRTTTAGLFYLFPQTAFFALFGSSIYSVRLAASLWGVASVPLMYLLVRRIAGIAPAVAATLLFIAAPEQLYWSRLETTCYSPVIFLGLVTANLGLWMVRRFSVPAVVAAALWTPMCRFFYMPAIVLFMYPTLLFVHTLIFVRGTWRKSWYVVPMLAAGIGLWFSTLTVMYGLVVGQWRFVNPAVVSGTNPWDKQGEFQGASRADLIRLQALSMSQNIARVVTSLTYRTGFTTWYQRADPSGRPTLLNVGFVLTAALGLSYLLGQLYDRRAWVLLMLVALGILPGILSTDPADRRIALVFPGLIATAGVMLGASVRVVREYAGRVLGWAAGAAVAVVAVVIAWSSAASFFLLPTSRPHLDQAFEFTRPIMDSEVVLHDLDANVALAMVFANAERFIGERPPCFGDVPARLWLDLILQPRCDYVDVAHRLTQSPQHLEVIRAQARPRTFAFLTSQAPRSEGFRKLLEAIYPNGQWRAFPSPYLTLRLMSVTVTAEEVAAVHSPSLFVGSGATARPDLQNRVLAGVRLMPGGSTEPESQQQGIVVRGGIYLREQDWYRVDVRPPCPGLTLTIDGQPVDPAMFRPMLAGIHSFEIDVPTPASCSLPLQVMVRSQLKPDAVALGPDSFVSDVTAAQPQVRATATRTYEGYSHAKPLIRATPQGVPADFSVDGEGSISVLLRVGSELRVQRLAPDGHVEGTWTVEAPAGQSCAGINVAPNGDVHVLCSKSVMVFDKSGARVTTWAQPAVYTSALGVDAHGRVLSPVPHESGIAILDEQGNAGRVWKRFQGGAGVFDAPVSVSANAKGDLVVIEDGGNALLFRNSATEFDPQFVRRFRLHLSELPVRTSGVSLDDQDHIFVPDPTTGTALVYNFDGERVMAAEAPRDISRLALGPIRKFVAWQDRLYALSHDGTLWSLAR